MPKIEVMDDHDVVQHRIRTDAYIILYLDENTKRFKPIGDIGPSAILPLLWEYAAKAMKKP